MPPTSPTFTTVTDQAIADKITSARNRIAYVAPGLGAHTAKALVSTIRDAQVPTTIILDSDADACRIGYSDLPALKALHETATVLAFPIRREPGLRIGLLVADDEVILWSPTPLAVEAERKGAQRNALVLTGSSVETINTAVAADSSDRTPDEAEIGRDPLKPAELDTTIADLEENPPAPVDLARKARVFSSRFQFVEFEVRGAEWTARKIKLSNFLLNADLPEELQDLLDTHVRPFQAAADAKFEVPLLLNGRPVFDQHAKRLTSAKTQAEVMKDWSWLRDEYLRHIAGFGWLIRRDRPSRPSGAGSAAPQPWPAGPKRCWKRKSEPASVA